MDRQDVSVTLPWMGAGTELLLRAVGALPGRRAGRPVPAARLDPGAPGRARRAQRRGADPARHLGPDRGRDADVPRPRAARRATSRSRRRPRSTPCARSWSRPPRPWTPRSPRWTSGPGRRRCAAPWAGRSRRPRCPGCGCARCGCTRWTWTPASSWPTCRRTSWTRLLDDATGTMSAKEGCPAVRLVPTDREHGWTLGPDADPVPLRGAAADLLGWLVGRTGGERLSPRRECRTRRPGSDRGTAAVDQPPRCARRMARMPQPAGAQLEAVRARRTALKEKYLQPPGSRPATTVRGVHHLALICRDVEETIRFYQELLGFPLVELVENRDYAGSSHFFFDIGNGNLLGFFDFPGPRPPRLLRDHRCGAAPRAVHLGRGVRGGQGPAGRGRRRVPGAGPGRREQPLHPRPERRRPGVLRRASWAGSRASRCCPDRVRPVGAEPGAGTGRRSSTLESAYGAPATELVGQMSDNRGLGSAAPGGRPSGSGPGPDAAFLAAAARVAGATAAPAAAPARGRSARVRGRRWSGRARRPPPRPAAPRPKDTAVMPAGRLRRRPTRGAPTTGRRRPGRGRSARLDPRGGPRGSGFAGSASAGSCWCCWLLVVAFGVYVDATLTRVSRARRRRGVGRHQLADRRLGQPQQPDRRAEGRAGHRQRDLRAHRHDHDPAHRQRADHAGQHPARLHAGDPRARPRQDQLCLRAGRRRRRRGPGAAGPHGRERHRAADRPLPRDRLPRRGLGGGRGRRGVHVRARVDQGPEGRAEHQEGLPDPGQGHRAGLRPHPGHRVLGLRAGGAAARVHLRPAGQGDQPGGAAEPVPAGAAGHRALQLDRGRRAARTSGTWPRSGSRCAGSATGSRPPCRCATAW